MKTLLLGDLSPTNVTSPLFKENDIKTLFGDSLSIFEGNDVNFVNLECALTEHDVSIEKFGPPLKAPAEVAKVIKSIGIDYCGLSNNHVFDFGKKGILDTIETLKKEGIEYTGFGDNYEDSRKNMIIEKDGERICIIAVCEHEYSYALENRMGSRPYDEYETIEDIRHAKETCDRVIVIYHGGKEQCRYPSPRLYRLCHAMARNGADVVICQHSHCVGCYEYYNDCHILYGQGNYHFVNLDYAKNEGWRDCLAVKYDTKQHKMEFIPLQMNDSGIELSKGEDKKAILDGFEQRNKELAEGKWRDGWHAFCEKVGAGYVTRIQRAFAPDADKRTRDVFGHNLDCEAHNDVLRELFPTANMTNEL